MTDARQYAPSAHRNRDLIRDQLASHWPTSGTVLEIASGSGEHVVHLAPTAPHLTFQPTDPSAEARASIDAWVKALALCKIHPALELDVTAEEWPIQQASMVLCCNMIHIAPWEATLGLMRGAGRVLTSGGKIWLYGPFIREGVETAEGNINFDVKLKGMDPRYGIRRLEDVADVAAGEGIGAPEVIEMPANNYLVSFARN